VKELKIDKRTLPQGVYRSGGFEARQVFEFEVTVPVTEYRVEVWIKEEGVQFIAEFPEGLTQKAQSGHTLKAHSVDLSPFQLIPLARIEDPCHEPLDWHGSKGSIFNWNQLAYEKWASFEQGARQERIQSKCSRADETVMNGGGKKIWLHGVFSKKVTLFPADENRGTEAMDREWTPDPTSNEF
jgi:transposase